MKRYYGNYLGLVIEDQDPEYRNRVKVFVPAISATILNRLNAKKKNVTISGIGINLPDGNGLDPEAYEELRKILPWAECAAPLFGGGTSFHYNPETKNTTNKDNVGAGTTAEPSNTPGDKTNPPGDKATQDSFSGTSNMVKMLASIALRESGAGQKSLKGTLSEAYSNYLNKASNNANVRKSGALLGSDFGIYQVNGENNNEAKAKGIGSLNGYDTSGKAIPTSFKEQTENVGRYIAEILNKRGKSKGVVDDINRGDFAAAEKKLNGVWPSLPGGGSYHSSLDAAAKKAQAGDDRYIRAVLDATIFTPGEQPFTADAVTASVRHLSQAHANKVNENVMDLGGSYTTAMPGGMFSTPKVNSHVWVFFNEGDPQYPVYFAQHIVIADWQRVKQVGSPATKTNTATASSRDMFSTIAQPGAGMMEMFTQQQLNADTGVMDNNSGIKLTSASGAVITLGTSGTSEYAPINKTVKVGGDNFETVEGHHNSDVLGQKNTNVREDYTVVVGDVSQDAIDAAKKIKDLLKTGHNRSIEDSKVPSEKRIKCPVCYGKVVSDKGTLASKLLTAVTTAILPFFKIFGANAPRHVKPILTAAVAPMKETTVKKMRKGGDCGSPNCVNGMIPDYNAKNAATEEAHLAYQESVYDQITAQEQQLGVGGNHATIVSRNSLLKVGLIMNDLQAHAKISDSMPIKNGMELVSGSGIVPKGSAVTTYKVMDVPTPPMGVCTIIAGTKFEVKAGSRGIHLQTTGNIQLDGGHLEITSNYLSLGNESGLTKINGEAVQIESKKSITLGGSPTNVHINGSAHVTANITTQGSMFCNGSLYAKSLVIPSSVQRTDMAGNADSVTGSTIWYPTAVGSVTKNTVAKKISHYNPVLHGMYAATNAGMNDLIVDWITKAQTSAGVDNFGAPTGWFVGIGGGPVWSFPHIHFLHNMSHEHSFKGPEGMYVNNKDEMYSLAAMTGETIPDPGA